MPATGQPGAAMIPVRGGNFGHDTETSLGALLQDAFGEGVLVAIQEIADVKTKEIAAEREKAAKAEEARIAKEEAAKEKEEAKEAKELAKEDKEAHKAVAPHGHAAHPKGTS